ncbi:zinc-binding dehydrogenase [Paeniglutamicibacter gangotriensis]|uniref:enoyl-[acyl-carrier-protein] reductase n=1 Tax=Paeniglutamicibacter gangotriensis TaxID=254787 RepID=A0A5B0EAN8_9MICC|nr:zinc-binding dehydrogenase [Paeniglutamicibacter gangotriensis]KAA0974790.1 zinc-binding dehydrogenase [Paeniglutamicibacter gangotriensis]
MRALMHSKFGDPAEVLTIENIPVPDPGPGEVRVRTLLSPIHNHDLWTIRGSYGFKPEFPARSGSEAVGIVDAMGEGVTGLEIGQRVATGGTFGVWAEYFIAKAAALIPVAEAIPDEVAAQLVSMPFSAISLVESLNLEEGDWLVQNAANGAVGRLVAQLAAARGINVIGLVRRSAGVEELSAQGIGNIVATDTEGWVDQVHAIAAGAPIIAGVDSVGGSASGEVLSLLAENGTLVVFGAMQSPVMEIGSGAVIFKQVTIRGFWGSKVSASMPAEKRRELMGELFKHLGAGDLTLPVEAIFSLEEAGAATQANFAPGRVGKIMLRP